jgi:hypothetical protein
MNSLNLVPVDNDLLKKMNDKYREFLHDGMTQLKAGYFAVTFFGFNDVLKTTKNHIQMVRLDDLAFVIFSYSIKKVPVVGGTIQPVNDVVFHTDLKVFDGGGDK